MNTVCIVLILAMGLGSVSASPVPASFATGKRQSSGGANASPDPMSLAARIRRWSSSGGVNASPDHGFLTRVRRVRQSSSNVATAIPSPSVASIFSSSFSSLSTTSSRRIYYNHLHVEARNIMLLHNRILANYTRNSSQVVPEDVSRYVANIPNTVDLPSQQDRTGFPESELVQLHLENLIIFKEGLAMVIESEVNSSVEAVSLNNIITSEMDIMIGRLRALLTSVSSIDNQPTVSNDSLIPQFPNDVHDEVRSVFHHRFHDYMAEVKKDCRVLKRRYARAQRPA